MGFRPIILASASSLSLLCAPALAQTTQGANTPDGIGAPLGTPTDAPEQSSDGTPAREATPDSEDEIVVTGVRASILGALNVKRNATQVVDSIVAEDVGKLPDNNVIEALQRVTGVQVTNRAGGEAAGISIRGLPDALTTMNGRNIFTASGQAFALADIPANLVKRIDVYKTRAADQIETGIAGQIDVFTRRPFDFDGFALSGVARGIYNEQADTFNPNVSGLISNRWETGIGDIGVLVSGSYARTKYRDMSVTSGAMVPFVTQNPPPGFVPLQRVFPESGAWQPGTERGLPTAAGSTFLLGGRQVPYYLSRDAVFSPDVAGTRERPAVSAAVQWSPSSDATYTAEFFWNQFKSTTQNSLFFSFVDWWGALGTNPGSTIELYPDTNIIKARSVGDVFGFNSGDYTRSKTDSFVYALNGDWKVGDNARVTADLSYQNSQFDTQFLAMRLTRVARRIDVDFNTRNGIPSYNFDNNDLLVDPTQWDVGEFYDNANRSKGDAITLHLDGENRWDNGFLRRVKAGIRVDSRNAMDSVRTQDAPGLGRKLSTLDPGLQLVNKDFFQGRASVPTSWLVPNGTYIYDNVDAIRQLYRGSVDPGIQLSDQLKMIDVFDINEITMTAYAMADGQFDLFGRPFHVQAGVRYVDVDTDLVFTDRLSGAVTGASQGTTRFLPSATLRWEITDNFRVRFNYGETLRRPGFADLNPNFNLTGDLTSIGRGSGSAGNPGLRPTVAKNYDFSTEWYFERNSALYATLFRREIDGLVVPLTSVLTIPNSGLNTNVFAVTRPENASNGVLKGAELGLTYFPTYLPSILDGFGFQGSLTLLDSKQNIPLTDGSGNVTGETESAFFGVSDLSFNTTLAYEKGGLGARLSYVWRKEFLANNEARLFANPIGVWRRPESSLDFQLTYGITDRLGLTLDAVNLTSQTQQNYYRFEDAGNADQFNLGTTLLSRTFAVGLRFSLD
ncbi:TonB-dependent receptor [Sphingomonas sp. Leaf25]|uniref:TonB-dependent receptor n=1 Tax=Sphingomonas sp. Leaf25 TaxID=1735692 RepID=UPI0006FFB684|nr:TonB-dependent receptor [Sphingomonas sp. Leaf25]KQN06432.1 TonB-dependent receptor [Sphingomonas sp. Leaf25]